MKHVVLISALWTVCGFLAVGAELKQGVACFLSDGSLRFEDNATECSRASAVVAASAAYLDSSTTASNFGKLRINASDSSIVAKQRYRAAGFLEGFLTAERTWHHFNNMKAYFETQLYPGVDLWGPPMDWLQQQSDWVQVQIQKEASAAFNLQRSRKMSKTFNIFSTHSTASHEAAGKVSSAQQHGSKDDSASHQLQPLTTLGAVELINAQFEGLIEGYAARVAAEWSADPVGGPARIGKLDRVHHTFMQNNGELYDIVDGWLAGAWGNVKAHHPDWDVAKWRSRWHTPKHASAWLRAVAVAERCSGIIKVTGDLSDLFIGHATWDTFTNMLHIFKHYDFGSPGFGRLSFSSYPGETFSDDDFYLSESGLVVIETTNHVFNLDVYKLLSTQTLLSWQRVRAAMLMADSGEDWIKVFSTLQSGTYNNQYMVVDLKRFKPKTLLAKGLLWVVEQLPGLVQALDVTDVLATGHWGSYNVPFFDKIYNTSGYPSVLHSMQRDQMDFEAMVTKKLSQENQDGEQADQQAVGSEFTGRHSHDYDVPIRWLRYQSSPRASILRRNASAAETLDQFKDLIRYNNYRHDPYSHGAPQAAICGREDLPHATKALPLETASRPRRPGAHAMHAEDGLLAAEIEMHPKGCYDGKVTSYGLAKQLLSEVVNGPTQSNGLPAFSWDAWSASTHMGHPTTFNFTWERMAAQDLPLPQLLN